MKKDEKLMALAQKLVKKGISAGADQMQVSIGSGNEFSVEVRDGKIEKLVEAGSKAISFKVILDGRVAYASSSDFSEETLQRLIENAVKRAKLTSSDPFAGLPEKSDSYVNPDSLNLFDTGVEELSTARKIECAKELEQIAMSDKRIKKSSGSYCSTNTGESILVNSNGFSGSTIASSCSYGVFMQSGEGDNMYEDGYGTSSVSFSGLEPLEITAKKAINKITRMLNAKKVKTQNIPVILEPDMTASILGFLYSCLAGSSIYMNQSFLAGKLNEKIAASSLSLIDDPLIPGRLGSRPYDGEGVSSVRKEIISAGILKNYFLDSYSARKLKLKSNASASGPGNLFIEKGNYSPEEIIKSVKKGLLLTRTIGQGTVATTGDISKGAFGLWIENGEIVHPVHEVTISGNLASMLNGIEMIGNDLDFRRTIAGPTIKISEMTLSGT